MSQKTIKYLQIRIDQLNEELAKNPSDENRLIIEKATSELSIVLDLLERTHKDKFITVDDYNSL